MSTKWCRFQADGKTAYGRIDGDTVIAIDGTPWESPTETSSKHKLSSVKLLIPTVPSTFFCVGINYRDHRIAVDPAISSLPIRLEPTPFSAHWTLLP